MYFVDKEGDKLMKSKNYSLVVLSIFMILFVFIASASAADVNKTDVMSAIDESSNMVNEKLSLDSSSQISYESNDTNVLGNDKNNLLSADNSESDENVLKVSEGSLMDTPLSEGASTWYVNASAAPDGNGTSKETAFQTLADAVNNASDGDTIMIASGTYSDVHLTFGKYLNFEKYGDGEAIIDGSYNSGIWTVTVTTININGLTFINGNTPNNGGAICFSSGISNSVINATFIRNKAQSDGGAIYSFGEIFNSTITSTFIDNTAWEGGAIYLMGGTSNSTINSIFINNTATDSYGGGAIVFKGGRNFTVEGEFINNTATKDGGAINFDWECYDVCVNATFINNAAQNGGAIYADYPVYNSTIDSTFINNIANEDGGAIYFKDLENSSISGKFINNAGKNVINSVNGLNKIHDAVFINNNVDKIVNFTSGNLTAEDIWFGNTAVNYNEAPTNFGIDLGNWLFLNATADSDVIRVNESSEITFILQSYNNSKISDYDASKMKVWLDLTQTLGKLDKTTALIGEKISYTANEIGNSTVAGKFETASYEINLKNIAPKIHTEINVTNSSFDLKFGDNVSSGASLTPADAGNLTYISSNSSVVIVKGSTIVAIGAGKANITVSFAGNDDYAACENKTIEVTVTALDAKVIVNKTEFVLFIGDGVDIVANSTPEGLIIDYSTDDGDIVSVDDHGNIKALRNGTATIFVSVGDNRTYTYDYVVVSVKVSKIPTEITLANETLDLKVNDMVDVLANLTPADAGNLTYYSSNESVVRVSEDGLIVAFSVGSANITVSFAGNDKYAACENKTISVNVSLRDASVSVENKTLDLKVDDRFDLNATTVPGYLNVQYVSSNESVVRVTDYGMVDAIGEGTAVITLTVGNNVTFAINSTTVTVKVSKIPTKFADVVVEGNNVSLILKDAYGNAIPNANISYTINGTLKTVVSDANGSFVIVGEPGALIVVDYAGSDVYVPSNISIKLAPVVVRQSTVILGNNFTQYAVDYNAGERGQNFTVQLVDANGNVLANKTVLIGYNGKTLERTTNATGHASVQINLRDKNRLTFAVTFLGDKEYNATMSVYLITINQKPVTIAAAAKTYKASAKTKKYTVTLKTIKGSSADGKTYFGAGKKVTMKINGKTYTAKTNAKGQATFNLKITKKGKFTAIVKYAGDNTYKSASKNVKITIK